MQPASMLDMGSQKTTFYSNWPFCDYTDGDGKHSTMQGAISYLLIHAKHECQEWWQAITTATLYRLPYIVIVLVIPACGDTDSK